jgi:hypothetical protein
MKARQVIVGAAFGPETFKVLTHAFDAAWSAISDQYRDKPEAQVEAARVELARVMLSVAKEGDRDVLGLKDAALRAMASSRS